MAIRPRVKRREREREKEEREELRVACGVMLQLKDIRELKGHLKIGQGGQGNLVNL